MQLIVNDLAHSKKAQNHREYMHFLSEFFEENYFKKYWELYSFLQSIIA